MPIRLAVVGLGRGFMLSLPALKAHPGIRLSACADPRPEARERFATEFGARSYDRIEMLLADSDVDAVYIATPHEFHAAQAIACARAGKHVLLEKPMATSIADCAAIEGAVREAGIVLTVGPSHAFDAPVKAAADLIASGRFGHVGLVNAFNYTDFLYRPRRPEELDTARGGGVVYSQGAHQVDVVRRLVQRPITSVRANLGQWDIARPCEGAYCALLSFEGGASASLTYSGYAHYDSDELVGWISELGYDKDPEAYPSARQKLTAISQGNEAAAKAERTYGRLDASTTPRAPHHEHFGFILVSCERADLRITPSGITIYGDTDRGFHAIPPPTLPRREVLDEFVDAILGGTPSLHDARWGLDTMACCAAILQSHALAKDVSPQSLIPFSEN